jgi:hypothetical protein
MVLWRCYGHFTGIDGERNHNGAPAAAMAALKQAATDRRLAQIGPEAKAAIRCRDWSKAAPLLEEAKAKLPHGRFLTWLEEFGIDKQAAQRCMRRVKSVI